MTWRCSAVWTLGLAFALAGCAHQETTWLPGPDIIQLADNQALPPDCRPLAEPSTFRGGTWQTESRPTIAFGCATYGNLARMLANPQDLVHPAPFAGQDAVTAGAAVQRYHDNKVTPLSTGGTTGSISGSGTQGGSSQ
jgi:hypothetical protein